MLYPDGQEAHIGDLIELWRGCDGIVVCSIDANEYSIEYPRKSWEHLGDGILVMSSAAGLVHYRQPERTMKLLKRSPRN